jgi:hypothetical protein
MFLYENQLDAQFSSLLNITLHVSDSLSVYHQEFKILHTSSDICHTD